MVEYRGATGFTGVSTQPFDATQINPYGNLAPYGDIESETTHFLTEERDWRRNLGAFDGARYFQIRLSFLNNVDTGLSATLSGLGIAFVGS